MTLVSHWTITSCQSRSVNPGRTSTVWSHCKLKTLLHNSKISTQVRSTLSLSTNTKREILQQAISVTLPAYNKAVAKLRRKLSSLFRCSRVALRLINGRRHAYRNFAQCFVLSQQKTFVLRFMYASIFSQNCCSLFCLRVLLLLLLLFLWTTRKGQRDVSKCGANSVGLRGGRLGVGAVAVCNCQTFHC